MDEMRFNRPPELNQNNIDSSEGGTKRGNKFMRVAVLVMGVVVVITVILWFWEKSDLRFAEQGSQNYSAVFLSNGQVYFGKIIRNTRNEITMNDVFYIQVGNNAGQMENRNQETVQHDQFQNNFSLIRVSSELHGPTDVIFINKSQVVFYEDLRDDSQVVQSIKGQQN